MEINIKLALAHNEQKNNYDVQKELESIQQYAHDSLTELEKEIIYFVPLQGNYYHVKRVMVLVGIIISTMEKSVLGVAGRLKTRMSGSDVQIADMTFEFPPQFLGCLNCGEGIPIHFEIPVIGLDKDCILKNDELLCELENVKILYKEEENDDEN